MSYYVNPGRKVQVFVNSTDYSNVFVEFTCTDDSANRNGIVTTNGSLVIGDNGVRDLQVGYRRSQFKRGMPVVINVANDDGVFLRHPRGTLVVLGVNYDIQSAQLQLQVGCILADALLRDNEETYQLVKDYSPYILPPDRKTWQNVGAALQTAGRYIFQNNAGGIEVGEFWSDDPRDYMDSGAVSVLGLTTMDASMLAGSSPIPDSVVVSYEYPVVKREDQPEPDPNEDPFGKPCTTDRFCDPGYICENGSCVPDPLNGSCDIDSDCPVGSICREGTCAPDPKDKCRIDYDCRFRDGKLCQDGFCVEDLSGDVCVNDDYCAEGYYCNENYECELVEPECAADGGCPDGFICNPEGKCEDDPTGKPCTGAGDCGDDPRFECVGGFCENTEGDECSPSRPCNAGYKCDYGVCVEEEDDDDDDDDDDDSPDPLAGKVVRVETESYYNTSYPAIAFKRKPQDDDPNLARIKRVEQKQKELAKVTGCGNTSEEPDDLGPTSCADNYETSRTNATVSVTRRSVSVTEYDGPGYTVSRREDYTYAPAFELNRQFYADKFAYCRASWSTGCQPNGNCPMSGQESILASKTINQNFFDKEGTVVKQVSDQYQTRLSVAIPSDWRAGIQNGIPQTFQDDISTSLFLAVQTTTVYDYQVNSTTVTTTTWTSKAVAAGSGIKAGDLDARRGIKKVDIEKSFGKNLNPPLEDMDDDVDDDLDPVGPQDPDPDGEKPFDPYDPTTWPREDPLPDEPPFDPDDPTTWPPLDPGFDPKDPTTWPEDPDGYDPQEDVKYVTTFLTGQAKAIIDAGGGNQAPSGNITLRENLPVPLYRITKPVRANIATAYAKVLAQFEKGSALGIQITEQIRDEWMENYKPGAKFHYYDPAADLLLVMRMDGTTWGLNAEEAAFTTDGLFVGESNGQIVIPDNTELS